MKLFPWKKTSSFFTADERQAIVEAVRSSEKRTSGEVRVFIEKRCAYLDAIDQAAEQAGLAAPEWIMEQDTRGGGKARKGERLR